MDGSGQPVLASFLPSDGKMLGVGTGPDKVIFCAHLAGLRPDQDEDLTDVLDASGLNPSGKRSRETITARVGAGSQPVRRAPPQLILEGLGPLLHWTLAHHTKRPSWVQG